MTRLESLGTIFTGRKIESGVTELEDGTTIRRLGTMTGTMLAAEREDSYVPIGSVPSGRQMGPRETKAWQQHSGPLGRSPLG